MQRFTHKFGILFSILFFIVLSGCKMLVPIKPQESYTYQAIKPMPSAINLYANLETAKLQSVVNKNVTGTIYDDNSFEDNSNDGLKLTAIKSGEIKLGFNDSLLLWQVPLKVRIQKRVTLFSLKIPMVENWEYTGNIVMRFKTKLLFNTDWSIKTITQPDGYEWIEKPSVKIGTISLPITLIANIILSSNKMAMAKEIDNAVTANMQFKTIAKQGWDLLSKPIKVPGDLDAWLKIAPQSVSVMPITGGNGFIRFGVAVVAQTQCLLTKPSDQIITTPLPALNTTQRVVDTFGVNLLTHIPYETINAMTMDAIGDSTFVFGTKKMKFLSFNAYSSKGKMIIETKVKGSIRGKLYFEGIPYFYAPDTTLRLRNLKFDIKTYNLVTKSAKWLFSSKIERTLMSAIAIPFGTDVREIENQLAIFLNKYPLGYGFELNGKFDRIGVSDIALEQNAVKANMIFNGKMAISIADEGLGN